ncbi:methyltransferase domain-containing protein [bacterium]|nr:methyltransferase domain-containing protein [bacterium]
MITKKDLLYNFIFRASSNKKIRTYYHLLEPLFHAMSDNNMYLNLGYHFTTKSLPDSVVKTQENMVDIVTKTFKKNGNWLDVGCGTGAPACYLAKLNNNISITGINIVESQIIKARNLAKIKNLNKRASFSLCDAQNISSLDKKFKNVYAIESAFHFENKQMFVTSAYDSLESNGKVAIADIIIKPELLSFFDFYKVSIAKHGLATKEFYTIKKWEKSLKRAGFRDIECEDITINVSSVLPKWINLIRTNEKYLLNLYPKLFLDMLCKCLQFSASKKEQSPFGYVVMRATK